MANNRIRMRQNGLRPARNEVIGTPIAEWTVCCEVVAAHTNPISHRTTLRLWSKQADPSNHRCTKEGDRR